MTRFKIDPPVAIIAQERNLRKFHTVTCRDAIKTSTQVSLLAFRYHALILLTGHRRQRNVYGQRHIAPVVGFHRLLARLVAGGGGRQSDHRHGGERKHEGTAKAHPPPIALHHHLGSGNLLTTFSVPDTFQVGIRNQVFGLMKHPFAPQETPKATIFLLKQGKTWFLHQKCPLAKQLSASMTLPKSITVWPVGPSASIVSTNLVAR